MIKPPTPFFKGEQLEQIFNQMWEVYPLKKAKQKALEALKKIFAGKPQVESEKLLEVICEGLKGHITEHQAKQQLKQQGADVWVAELPHFSTWLNQKRWEDGYQKPQEILQAATRKKGGIVDIRKVFGGNGYVQ